MKNTLELEIDGVKLLLDIDAAKRSGCLLYKSPRLRDCFEHIDGGPNRVYRLIAVTYNMACLINIRDLTRYSDAVNVKHMSCITNAEWSSICGNLPYKFKYVPKV